MVTASSCSAKVFSSSRSRLLPKALYGYRPFDRHFDQEVRCPTRPDIWPLFSAFGGLCFDCGFRIPFKRQDTELDGTACHSEWDRAHIPLGHLPLGIEATKSWRA